jgi:hypothetical protein
LEISEPRPNNKIIKILCFAENQTENGPGTGPIPFYYQDCPDGSKCIRVMRLHILKVGVHPM